MKRHNPHSIMWPKVLSDYSQSIITVHGTLCTVLFNNEQTQSTHNHRKLNPFRFMHIPSIQVQKCFSLFSSTMDGYIWRSLLALYGSDSTCIHFFNTGWETIFSVLWNAESRSSFVEFISKNLSRLALCSGRPNQMQSVWIHSMMNTYYSHSILWHWIGNNLRWILEYWI